MKVKCQNCGWVGSDEECAEAEDVEQRHEVGDVFSNLECPRCDALCYPLRKKPTDYVIDEDSDTRCREIRHVCQKCGRECAADDSECSCGGMITDVPVPDSEAEDHEEEPEEEDLNWYTVIGVYPDYQDESDRNGLRESSFCHSILADSPSDAIKQVIDDLDPQKQYEGYDPKDWEIIAVFCGQQEDCYPY